MTFKSRFKGKIYEKSACMNRNSNYYKTYLMRLRVVIIGIMIACGVVYSVDDSKGF